MPISAKIYNSEYVFGGCTNIKKVMLTKGNGAAQNYGKETVSGTPYTFYAYTPWSISGCNEIVIEDEVIGIGCLTFYNCTNLTSIIIPDSIESIGYCAFENTGFYNDSTNWENEVLYIGNHLIKAKSTVSGEYTIKEGTITIADEAFYELTDITGVVISESVTNIGSHAFYVCTGLASITIPDSVTSIGNSAFSGCTNLTSITIGDGVTDISSSSFSDTGYYNDSANWENEVLYIGNYLIEAKSAIPSSYTVKSGTKIIADYAFRSCTSLVNITIPDSVMSIGDYAFDNCSGLETTGYTGSESQWDAISIGLNNDNLTQNIVFNFQPTETYYGAGTCGENLNWCLYADGKLVISGTGAMTDYEIANAPWEDNRSLIKTIVIEDGVTSIGVYAFWYCPNLISVTIPDSVTTIKSSSFAGNSGIDTYYTGDIADWCAIKFLHYANPLNFTNNFYINDSLIEGNLIIPDSVTNISSYAFSGYAKLESVEIPDSVTAIGSYAFNKCTGLKSVTIPDSVTTIGMYAFSDCTSLESAIISDNVTSIGIYAFQNCESLSSVTLSNKMTEISEGMFEGCTVLSDITVPESIIFIRADAFNACDDLSRAYYNGNQTQWSSVTVEENNESLLNNIVIDASSERPHYISGTCGTSVNWTLYVDGELMISGSGPIEFSWSSNPWENFKSKIKSITIESGITSIQRESFDDCINLTTVIIPDSVTSIGAFAFRNCPGIKSVTIPEGVRVINYGLFENCTSLEKVTILGDIYRIEGYPFRNTALPFENGSLYIQNHLVEVKPDVQGSYVIKEGTLGIAGDAFSCCTGITEVIIPESIEYIGSEAFFGCAGLTEVTIPGSVYEIEDSAFENCDNLESVTILEGCGVIGVAAFCDCDKLEEVRLPKSISNIKVDAFYTDKKIHMYYPGTQEQWDNVTKMETTYDSNIYSHVVLECDSARPYYYPYTCGFDITAKLYIDGELLINGSGSMSTEDTGPWYDKRSKIISITISDGVTVIAANSFNDCPNLTSVVIPNSVMVINEAAFKNCPNLEKVYFNGTQEEWEAIEYNDWFDTIPEIIFKGHDHVYTEKIIAEPTCTTSGEKMYSCGCGESYSEMIFATGHSFDYYVQEPTCKEEGYNCFKCTVCGEETERESTGILEHTPGEWVTESVASCATIGLKVKRCTVCNEELEREETPATGHTNTLVVLTAPTCGEEGVGEYTCLTCGNVSRKKIPATGEHTLNLVRKEPTCSTYGSEYYICTVCGNMIGDTVILSKLDHTYGEWVVETQVTCTENGLNVQRCTVCNIVLDSQTIEKLGHTAGEWAVETQATCTENGLNVQRCITCNEVLDSQTIEMLEHTPGNWRNKIRETCYSTGLRVLLCSICNTELDSEVIPITDHNYKYKVVTLPTCDEDGVGRHYCSYCNEGYVEAIPSTGHSYIKEIITEPTCVESGIAKYTCSSCGGSYEESIPALGFETSDGVTIDFTTNTISGINAGENSLDSYVTVVNDSYTWEYVTTTGTLGTGSTAILKDGETVIGEYTILIYGDTNGDGWYDGMDSMIVSCLVNGILTEDNVSQAVYKAADCNHDGMIDALDIAVLEQAGLLLANVDQSKSTEELQLDSAYMEYIEFIDQTPEVEDETPTVPEEEPEQLSVLDIIINLIKSIIDMVYSYFSTL